MHTSVLCYTAAPQEVIERINSLLEEQPTLHLTEVANGDELTADNGGIHSEFKVFATANMRRVHTNKLSTALLNRVLRVWLPPLDAELLEAIAAVDASSADVVKARTQAIEKANTFALVCNLLPDVVGKCKLAHVLLWFHIYMQQRIADKAITLAGGAVLTFRHLERTISSIHTRLTQQSNKTTLPVPALIEATRLNYIDCVITDNSKGDVTLHTVLNSKLDTLLATPAIQDAVQPEHTRVNAIATQQPWQIATSELSIAMSSLEGLAVTLAAISTNSMSPSDTCGMLTVLLNSKLAPVTDTTTAAARLQQFKAAQGHITAVSTLVDDVHKDCSAVLKHIGLTVDPNIVTDASLKDIPSHIQRLYHLACEAVVQLANGASLQDAKQRWRVLQRVVETCGAHAALLESVHSEQESLVKAISVCRHALQAVTQLTSRTVLRYGELLCMQELQQLRQACQHVLKAESGSLQHYYVLQKHLILPIASSTTTGALMSLAAKLVHKLEQVDSSCVIQLRRLCIAAQWTGIAYNALVAIPRAAEPDTDMSSDKLLETATLLDTELNMRLCKVLSAIEAPLKALARTVNKHKPYMQSPESSKSKKQQRKDKKQQQHMADDDNDDSADTTPLDTITSAEMHTLLQVFTDSTDWCTLQRAMQLKAYQEATKLLDAWNNMDSISRDHLKAWDQQSIASIPASQFATLLNSLQYKESALLQAVLMCVGGTYDPSRCGDHVTVKLVHAAVVQSSVVSSEMPARGSSIIHLVYHDLDHAPLSALLIHHQNDGILRCEHYVHDDATTRCTKQLAWAATQHSAQCKQNVIKDGDDTLSSCIQAVMKALLHTDSSTEFTLPDVSFLSNNDEAKHTSSGAILEMLSKAWTLLRQLHSCSERSGLVKTLKSIQFYINGHDLPSELADLQAKLKQSVPECDVRRTQLLQQVTALNTDGLIDNVAAILVPVLETHAVVSLLPRLQAATTLHKGLEQLMFRLTEVMVKRAHSVDIPSDDIAQTFDETQELTTQFQHIVNVAIDKIQQQSGVLLLAATCVRGDMHKLQGQCSQLLNRLDITHETQVKLGLDKVFTNVSHFLTDAQSSSVTCQSKAASADAAVVSVDRTLETDIICDKATRNAHELLQHLERVKTLAKASTVPPLKLLNDLQNTTQTITEHIAGRRITRELIVEWQAIVTALFVKVKKHTQCNSVTDATLKHVSAALQQNMHEL
jgi:hypothetical protein